MNTITNNAFTVATDPADIGATVAALLDELPDVAFATRLRDAIDAEHIRMYQMGLKHGGSNAWKAIDEAWAEFGLEKPQPAAPSRPELRVLVGGAAR